MNELVEINHSYSKGEFIIKADKSVKRVEVILSDTGISIAKVIVETKDELQREN